MKWLGCHPTGQHIHTEIEVSGEVVLAVVAFIVIRGHKAWSLFFSILDSFPSKKDWRRDHDPQSRKRMVVIVAMAEGKDKTKQQKQRSNLCGKEKYIYHYFSYVIFVALPTRLKPEQEPEPE